MMKEEYDFTNAEQGKFYIPLEEIEVPIYLDSLVPTFQVGMKNNAIPSNKAKESQHE